MLGACFSHIALWVPSVHSAANVWVSGALRNGGHINCNYVVRVKQLWISRTSEITHHLQPPGPCSKIGFVCIIKSCCWRMCMCYK